MEDESGRRAIEALRATIAGCRACAEAGHFIDGSPLLGAGPCPAPLFVLGQAPALVHTQKPGRPPFSPSRHGQPSPLWKWLEQAGFAAEEFRDLAYITAVTRCYPGRARNGSGDRRPSAAEQQLCSRYWRRELALVQPRLVLALGTLALDALGAGRRRLDEVVGQVLTMTAPDGRPLPLIPLPHPSGVSRWLNTAAHRAQLDQALAILADERPALAGAALGVGLPEARQ
ncbi:MAG: hypothetical protein M5U01_16240 [Ardenticatenaceae bacterium]|nr:hypothetical protein [Ardenticatenaceae bacterium]